MVFTQNDGYTMVSSNNKMSVVESIENIIPLTFLKKILM